MAGVVAVVVVAVLAYELVAYMQVQRRRQAMLKELSEAGVEVEMLGDTLLIPIKHASGDVNARVFAQVLARATAEERRAFTAAQFLMQTNDKQRSDVEVYRERGFTHIGYTYVFGEGGTYRVAFSLEEMDGLCDGTYDSWRTPIRGALRSQAEVCEELFPLDANGETLRGSALERARRTTDLLLLTPARLDDKAFYEVYSRPAITPEDVAANALDEATLSAKLGEMLSNAQARSVIARVFLADLDFVSRYEAPDGAAFELRFPAEMVRREFGKLLRGEL